MTTTAIPEVEASARNERGSAAVRALREGGQVPAVLYGQKKDNIDLAIDTKKFETLLRSRPILVKLAIDGKPEHAIIKDVQYDYVGPKLQHVDFQRVSLDEEIRVNVPLEFYGTPAGADQGGKIEVVRPHLAILVRADKIPHNIVVPVAELKLGDSLRCKDVTLPAGAKLVSHPESFIC
ncbi:MAG: 50S ribosomal protein L25, partial [Planctomycetes bacterium]|nr:50S ribosomal protein L25 [Planctomycetota bacterium]